MVQHSYFPFSVLPCALAEINSFSSVPVFKVSCNKSQALTIHLSVVEEHDQFEFRWTNKTVQYAGINILSGVKKTYEMDNLSLRMH